MRIFLIILVIVAVNLAGVLVGRATAPQPRYSLKPYTGLGSGVLKHGTIVKQDYKNPADRSGTLDVKGVWLLEENQ